MDPDKLNPEDHEAYGAMVAKSAVKNHDFDLTETQKEFLAFVRKHQEETIRKAKNKEFTEEELVGAINKMINLEFMHVSLLFKKMYEVYGDRIEPDSDLGVAISESGYNKMIPDDVIEDTMYQMKYAF
jgi:hypothetical protein